MQASERVEILEYFVMEHHRVPQEDGKEITFLKDWRSSTSGVRLFWDVICYTETKSSNMVGFQGEHSVSGRN
jgi:hypothetical protein